MSSNKGYSDAKIDDILQEIGQVNEGGAAGQPSDEDIESILLGLGMGGKKRRRPSSFPVKETPVPEGKPKTETLPQDEIPVQTADTKKNTAASSAGEPPEQKRPLPRNKRKPLREPVQGDIMDIKVQKGDMSRRAGKAAIMDEPGRVNRFENDAELASLFSGVAPSDAPLKKQKNRKQQRMAEEQARPTSEPQKTEWADDVLDALDDVRIYDTPPHRHGAAEEMKEQMQREDVEVGKSVAENVQQEYDRYKDLDSTQLLKQKNIETSTKIYESETPVGLGRIPKALLTQRIDLKRDGSPSSVDRENLEKMYIDVIVDDRFRDFFNKSVAIVDPEQDAPTPRRKKKKKSISTGEFALLENKVRKIEDDNSGEDTDDYNHLKDAERIQEEINALKISLYKRAGVTGVLGLLMLWMQLGMQGTFTLPQFLSPAKTNPMFAFFYLAFAVAALVANYKTIVAGIGGLFTKATIETTPALGLLAVLGQAIVLLFTVLNGGQVQGTLFGCLIALVLVVHSIGKVMQTSSILKNFSFASSGKNYSAAYILNDRLELAYDITTGLEEQDPALLLSRSTTLMKGFMRQSFSQRLSDRINRVLGWIILSVALLIGLLSWFGSKDAMAVASAVTAVFAFGVPLSSSLGAAFPSMLLQRNAAKAGAVVPGWSAMDALGNVNVVMAESKDIFPPESVQVQKVTVYEHDSIDSAILYAASVLVEGCDTLREAFLEMVDYKKELLYPLDGIKCEPGRGFIAWANDSRVVVGSREMLQQNGVHPPPVKEEMQQLPENCVPLYLVVSSRLLAMFAIEYRPDVEADDVLAGLVKSGSSLLIESFDVNVNVELIENTYRLPPGMVKVLGVRELKKLTPLTKYLPESEGVMAHLGGFASLIGGMRAAFGASTSEKLACYLQLASVILAGVLCLLLALSGTLANLALLPIFLYQLAWCVLVSGVPFTRSY